MANTYTWSFPALDAYPQHEGQTDVVFTVHWILNGIDGNGHDGSVYGTVAVTYNAGSPFTPFAQVTKDQVYNWVIAALGAEKVTELQANIDKQIQEKANPTVVSLSPPWAN
jgi:hypothetical protein